jgi:hypothetical protein
VPFPKFRSVLCAPPTMRLWPVEIEFWVPLRGLAARVDYIVAGAAWLDLLSSTFGVVFEVEDL